MVRKATLFCKMLTN